MSKTGYFGISTVLLPLVLSACSGGTPNWSRQVKTTKTRPNPISTKSPVQRLGEPKDSSCRGYKAPPKDPSNGCELVGPYPGEINGAPIGNPGSLEEAFSVCKEAPNCTGVSTPWYLDKPFTAYAQTRPFQNDEDSYGCTFILDCDPAECPD